MLALLTLADPSSTDLSVFGQYGLLGVCVAALIWFARTTVLRERERADRLDLEVARLNSFIQEKVIPALVSETHAMNEYTALLRDVGSRQPPNLGR